MSAHTQIILAMAHENHELAEEIFCELYIYTHYSEDEVGVDMKAYTYQYDWANKSDNSWLNNLMYRLSSIFRRRGLCFAIDTNDVAELLDNRNELGISLQELFA